MTIRIRRILYLTFIGLFFVITPLLILYASGYRYNLKRNRIEKTGILIVDSLPRKAQVYINGMFEDETPARFPRLLPDTYTLELKRSGFHPWQQEVSIESSLTTFRNDIVLFRDSLPITIVQGRIAFLTLLPNREALLYSVMASSTQQLTIRDLSTNSATVIPTTVDQAITPTSLVGFSQSGSRALLATNLDGFTHYTVLDTATLETIDLFDITRLDFDTVKWDQASDTVLYGLRRSVLYRIDLEQKSASSIISAHITDFLGVGQTIYYVTKVGSESFLNITQTQNPQEPIQKIKIPSLSNYQLTQSADGQLVLLDTDQMDLFVVDQATLTAQSADISPLLSARAKNIAFNREGNGLLYYTDFELWVHSFETGEAQLINRVGQQITEALFYPDRPYIIYAQKGQIRAIEITDAPAKNDIVLTSIQRISDSVLSRDGSMLYFIGQVGNTEGIFSLQLR